MAYKELSKLFYASHETDRFSWLDEEAERRRSSPSSIDVGVSSRHGDMFVAMPPELLALVEQVYVAERDIALKFEALPVVARRALVRGLVIDEVVSTNAIENIHSTRKQVAAALEATPSASSQGRRFRELALLYLSLGDGTERRIETPEDIHSVYDRIMDGEDLGANAPDGELFRKGGVEVVGPGGKRVHEGLEPEAKIFEAVNAMLRLLDRTDAPSAVLAMAAHYVFEFAHPFYDGNGRTGRYLLSLQLSHVLSIPTVLSMSRAILEKRDAYYRAFRSAGDPLNKGELTFFVMDMFALLRSAQDTVSFDMDRGAYMAQVASGNLARIAQQDGISPKECDVIEALTQIELFGKGGSASMESIADAVGIKPQMVRKHVARLEERGLVAKTSGRPLRVSLSETAKIALGIE